MKKTTRKGLQGRVIKIKPDVSDAFLGMDDKSTTRGTIVACGPSSICKIGDQVIFNGWARDEIEFSGELFYYISDEFVLEIL